MDAAGLAEKSADGSVNFILHKKRLNIDINVSYEICLSLLRLFSLILV